MLQNKQVTYPEYYFVTYYKKIEDNILYTDVSAIIERNEFTFKVKIEKDHLFIGVLFDENASINMLLKHRYVDAKIPLIPEVKTIEILDDEDKFYKFILEKISSVYKQIKSPKGSEDYNNISSLLSQIFQYIINKARNELDLYNYIYREKFRGNPTDNETKEWFFEFSYNLRNVLFHRVVDPFDKKWTDIVKFASQALYDIVVLNIERLNTI